MNQDQMKGKLDSVKGHGKEALGDVTGNSKHKAEGAVDRVKGAAKDAVGKAKEAISDVKSSIANKAENLKKG